MTIWQKRGLVGLSVSLSLGLLLLVVASLSHKASSEEAPLRVTLIAQATSFVHPQRPLVENPTLRLPAGRVVEIEFRNDDPGSTHDLALEELGLQTGPLKTGEFAVLRFTTPNSGSISYSCTFHPVMMRGRIVFVARTTTRPPQQSRDFSRQ